MANTFGVLFDLDGTLVDNEQVKAISFSRAINELGGDSSPDAYKEVMGMSGPIIGEHFIRTFNLQVESETFFDLYKSIYEVLLIDGLVIRPGVIDFLDQLRSEDFLMAIVSGSYRQSVEWIIKELQIAKYFDTVITGDDVVKKKPDPECYMIALEKLKLQNVNAIVFEDSEAGIIACKNVGIRAFGIRHEFNQSHDFSYAMKEYTSFESDQGSILDDLKILFSGSNF